MKLPVALRKQSSDEVHFDQNWTYDLDVLGLAAASITESHWSVEFGTVVLAATHPNAVNGLITTTHVSGGAAGEHFVLNNSIVLSTTDRLVQRFAGVVEPPELLGELPALIKAAGDNVPFTYDWADYLETLQVDCPSITVSNWAVEFGDVLLNADARPNTLNGTVVGTYVSAGTAGQNSIIRNSVTIEGMDNALIFADVRTKLFKIKVIDGSFT